MKYAALLRGISTSSTSSISENEVAAAFKTAGGKNISVYLQSANVIFECNHVDPAKITKTVEGILSKKTSFSVQVLLRTIDQIKKILAEVPKDWSSEADVRRYILYLTPGLVAETVVATIPKHEAIDSLVAGDSVLYLSTTLEGLTKNKLKKLVGKDLYKEMTLRNYVASKKLLELLFTELI